MDYTTVPLLEFRDAESVEEALRRLGQYTHNEQPGYTLRDDSSQQAQHSAWRHVRGKLDGPRFEEWFV